MIDRLHIRADDRVLLLSIPDPTAIRALAARLSKGLVVVLGAEDEVHAARRAAADLDNCMFVPAGPEEVPWSDGFFTMAIALGPLSADPERAAQELARVLAPGGTLCMGGGQTGSSVLRVAGFEEIRREPDLLIARKTGA